MLEDKAFREEEQILEPADVGGAVAVVMEVREDDGDDEVVTYLFPITMNCDFSYHSTVIGNRCSLIYSYTQILHLFLKSLVRVGSGEWGVGSSVEF
jgi:hypothetical protein